MCSWNLATVTGKGYLWRSLELICYPLSGFYPKLLTMVSKYQTHHEVYARLWINFGHVLISTSLPIFKLCPHTYTSSVRFWAKKQSCQILFWFVETWPLSSRPIYLYCALLFRIYNSIIIFYPLIFYVCFYGMQSMFLLLLWYLIDCANIWNNL